MTMQDLVNDHLRCSDCPNRKCGGEPNDGTYFEIQVSLEHWYREHKAPPKKKLIKGLAISFLFYDIDTDEERMVTGQIRDYKFLNEYRDTIILMIGNCKGK
jgi:hypothetical protein